MKKILLVLLDGIGDRIYCELGERTPLEAADTPHLDRIAAEGASAAVYPLEPGFAPAPAAAGRGPRPGPRPRPPGWGGSGQQT